MKGDNLKEYVKLNGAWNKGKTGIFTGSSNPMYGKKHSPESLIKMRAAKLGKKWTVGQREKLSGPNSFNWKGGRSKDKEYRYKQATEWRKNNLIRSRELHRNWRVRKREKSAGSSKSTKCEICHCVGIIVFDHDHKTKLFRGWICDKCNVGLGMAKDNPIILRAMADYLEKQR